MQAIKFMKDRQSTDPCECHACGWQGTAAQAAGIVNAETRVIAGELTPLGQCPVCGSFARLVNTHLLREISVTLQSPNGGVLHTTTLRDVIWGQEPQLLSWSGRTFTRFSLSSDHRLAVYRETTPTTV